MWPAMMQVSGLDTVRSKIVHSGNSDYVDDFLDPSKFQDDTCDDDQAGSIRKWQEQDSDTIIIVTIFRSKPVTGEI